MTGKRIGWRIKDQIAGIIAEILNKWHFNTHFRKEAKSDFAENLDF